MARKHRSVLRKVDDFQCQINDGLGETFFFQIFRPKEKPKALNHHKINGCGNG
jgi:azurin